MRPRAAGIALLLIASAGAVGAIAQSDQIRVRALGPHISDQVIRYVAANAAALPVREALLARPKLTAREVIVDQCGSVRDTYVTALMNMNQLTGVTIDEPLGPRAAALKVPACLYVSVQPFPRKVRKGETASHIYISMTGGGGNAQAMRKFFKASVDKGVDIGNVNADMELVGAYLTRPVMLDLPSLTPEEFWDGIGKAVASSGGEEMVVWVRGSDSGSIITEAEDSLNCAAIAGPPFDPAAVERAFRYAIARKDVQRARVVIIDNGFLGADPSRPPKSAFDGSPFLQDYFVEEQGRSLIARRIPIPNGSDIYALNSLNGSQPAPESGHGTHVAGLVFGGPSFRPYWKTLRSRDSELPWIEVIILNVGLGQKSLIKNAHELFQRHLKDEQPSIVNMSIAYEPEAYTVVAPVFDQLFQSRHLFVTSAGNEHVEVAANIYPAGAGGVRSNNVITVAALDDAGRLAPFTNRGSDTVDIAAPGCEVPSWTQNDEQETRMSGTSQAAPLVTFAAALLRTFAFKHEMKLLKARLIVSGDLLHRDDQRFTAYRVALNVPKSLYWFDDYVRLRGKDAGEYLGDVRKLSGVKCSARDGPAKAFDTWAFKRGPLQSWIYQGKPVLLKPCEVAEESNATLVFTPRFRITSNAIEPMNQSEGTWPLNEVMDVVYRMPAAN